MDNFLLKRSCTFYIENFLTKYRGTNLFSLIIFKWLSIKATYHHINDEEAILYINTIQYYLRLILSQTVQILVDIQKINLLNYKTIILLLLKTINEYTEQSYILKFKVLSSLNTFISKIELLEKKKKKKS